MSAFSQKYWAAGFVQATHGVLDRSGVDLVLKVPGRDYDAASQAHHLRRILATRYSCIDGVIVATEVHRLRPDLAEFCGELALPVVFTDIEPFHDESQYPDNAAFVGYRSTDMSTDLGTLAGQWLALVVASLLVPLRIGVPLTNVVFGALRGFADLHRLWAVRVLGRPIPRPYRQADGVAPIADPATWRDAGWLPVNATVGHGHGRRPGRWPVARAVRRRSVPAPGVQ